MHRLATALAFVLVALPVSPPVALAADAEPVVAPKDDPTHGDIVLLPGPMPSLEHTHPEPEAPAASRPPGWHLAGRHFRAGDGWWAMNCRKTCTLSRVKLAVSALRHPSYDSPPVPGQHLVWTHADGTVVQGDSLMLLFKPVRGLATLPVAVGPLRTWLHRGMGRYPRPQTPGTMEVLIPAESGALVLKPRLQRGTGQIGAQPEHDTLWLELQAADGRRQRLGAYEWSIEGPRGIGGPEFLPWAGDLDGDGKPDLLVSYRDRGWNTVLYLSSLAKPGELVGEAGSFVYWPPNDAGC